jgi:hypothetical protein
MQRSRLLSGTVNWRPLGLAAAIAAALITSAAGVAGAAPLLPDLVAWETDDPPYYYMHDGSMDLQTVANKVLYRYSQPIANIGVGALELREITHPNLDQDIYQRVYDSDGGVSERFVGTFPDADPPYGHLFLVGIAEYRIRTITAGNGVGPIVASKIKTSYGLYDYDDYDTSLPNSPNLPQYQGQNQYLGISVGWADVYPSTFAGQFIDVTGLPSGQYWLESEIDPFNLLQESDDTNNITRVLVNLAVPEPAIMPGDYNDDVVADTADYVVWKKMLGKQVAAGTSADGDGNGKVEASDLQVWQGAYGTTTGSGSSNGAVPEPAAGALLVTVGAFCRVRRRR